MQELTEREKTLLEIVKKLVSILTIYGISSSNILNHIKLVDEWKYNALKTIEFDMKWQDDMLKMLEREYGVKYDKVDDTGKPLEESDGDKD